MDSKTGMTITITLDTSNAAFEGDTLAEVGRIIQEWAAQLGVGPLYDINGNKVGSVKIAHD